MFEGIKFGERKIALGEKRFISPEQLCPNKIGKTA